jgi:muramidase (phage lysozyme)
MTINISRKEQALLQTITSTESPGYDAMYGARCGSTDRRFTSYADHPRQFHTITSGPHKGEKTSAAGNYQFIGSTWDEVAGANGLTDFSPANQDRGAILLARQRTAP